MTAKEPGFESDGFVMRRPLLPSRVLEDLQAPLTLVSGRDVSDGEIQAALEEASQFASGLLHDPAISEALYVASPALHAAVCAQTAQGKSSTVAAFRPLASYLTRMSSRSTPF